MAAKIKPAAAGDPVKHGRAAEHPTAGNKKDYK